MRRIALAALAALALACGSPGPVGTAAAQAATHTLQIQGPTRALVGQPLTYEAFGTAAAPAEWWDLSWLEAAAIPTSALDECPAGGNEALTLAELTGGTIMAISLRPNVDQSGSFSNRFGYTPGAPGTVLICGYLVDGEGYTYSAQALRLTVAASGSPAGGDPGGTLGAARPVNRRRPWVTRRGRELTCHPGRWARAGGGYSYTWLFDGRHSRATGREV
ncbi:MAG: hypothetical protein ACM3NV_00160, partial [Syntrophothermus sp.]